MESRPDDFYKRLNAMLRGDLPSNERLLYYADLISSAISKFHLEHDIICYRKMHRNPFPSVKTGDIITLDQFISTSVVKKGTLTGNYMVTIKVPSGTRGAYIERLSYYKKQREFLLDRGLEYRVLAAENDNMLLEVI